VSKKTQHSERATSPSSPLGGLGWLSRISQRYLANEPFPPVTRQAPQQRAIREPVDGRIARQNIFVEQHLYVSRGRRGRDAYAEALRRILDTFNSVAGKRGDVPAVWISGFYGSGKSLLASMLGALWSDLHFDDGWAQRGNSTRRGQHAFPHASARRENWPIGHGLSTVGFTAGQARSLKMFVDLAGTGSVAKVSFPPDADQKAILCEQLQTFVCEGAASAEGLVSGMPDDVKAALLALLIALARDPLLRDGVRPSLVALWLADQGILTQVRVNPRLRETRRREE
jgi:hypothetical protein